MNEKELVWCSGKVMDEGSGDLGLNPNTTMEIHWLALLKPLLKIPLGSAESTLTINGMTNVTAGSPSHPKYLEDPLGL